MYFYMQISFKNVHKCYDKKKTEKQCQITFKDIQNKKEKNKKINILVKIKKTNSQESLNSLNE